MVSATMESEMKERLGDYLVFNGENGGFDSTGQTLVAVDNLSIPGLGDAITPYYAEADINSGNLIMTVPAAAIGVAYDRKFRFDVEAHDNYFALQMQDGLSDAIRFTGFLPAENLPLWYNSAETFIYPSVYEGFGLPVVEAMACGTPVITSSASSLPEAAGDAALIVSPHDTPALTQALRHTYHNREWRERARLDGLRQAARFSWKRTAEITIDSYRKGLE